MQQGICGGEGKKTGAVANIRAALLLRKLNGHTGNFTPKHFLTAPFS
jgi:hypothetical protein